MAKRRNLNANVEAELNGFQIRKLVSIRKEMREYDFNYEAKKSNEIRLIIKTFITSVLKSNYLEGGDTRRANKLFSDYTDVFVRDVINIIAADGTECEKTILLWINTFVNDAGPSSIAVYCKILKTILKKINPRDNQKYLEYSNTLILTSLLYEVEYACYLISNTSFELNNNGFSLSDFNRIEPAAIRERKDELVTKLTESLIQTISDRVKGAEAAAMNHRIKNKIRPVVYNTDSYIVNCALVYISNPKYVMFDSILGLISMNIFLQVTQNKKDGTDGITMPDIFDALMMALTAKESDIESDVLDVLLETGIDIPKQEAKKENKPVAEKANKPEPEVKAERKEPHASVGFQSVEEFWEVFSGSELYACMVNDFYTDVEKSANSLREKEIIDNIAYEICKSMDLKVLIKLNNDNILLTDMVSIYKTDIECFDKSRGESYSIEEVIKAIPRSRLTKLVALMGACAASTYAYLGGTTKLADIDEYYNAIFAELNNEPDKESVLCTGTDIITRQLRGAFDKLMDKATAKLQNTMYTRPVGSGTVVRTIDDIIAEITNTNTSVKPPVQPSPNPTIVSGTNGSTWIFKNGKPTRLI